MFFVSQFIEKLMDGSLGPEHQDSQLLRTLGISWGNPRSVSTYCGIPYFVFRELKKAGWIEGLINSQHTRPADLLRGAIDWQWTIRDCWPRCNALWRYLPENMDVLSKRLLRSIKKFPQREAILQFDVAGIPPSGNPVVAYIEMSVGTAIAEEPYALSHGFAGYSDQVIERALEGERCFLDHCSVIWTNSEWTAEGLKKQGVPDDKLRVYAPACGVPDPGEIAHDWTKCNLLFIGIDWKRKGGDILVDAFRLIRKKDPAAKLTIIGCSPRINDPGVEVLGYLRKNRLGEAKLFRRALEEATIYCMPTRWDSTGIPFMEGAMYGLPVIMSAGQGREKIFPAEMAIQIDNPDAESLAGTVIELSDDPDRMMRMGQAGRSHILHNYTWEKGIQNIKSYLLEAYQKEYSNCASLT
jgi:glycosyltransferase involved in cell wall biosynthesis